MPIVNEGFVVDERGARVGVILRIEDYHTMLEELEESSAPLTCPTMWR